MSFPWHDHIALLGDGVKLCSTASRAGRGGGRVDPVIARASADVPQALDALLGTAPRGKWRRLDTLTVLAGFPHVHYTVLPWQDTLIHPAERQAYARGLLTQRYDLPGDDWLVWLEETGFGRPGLAAAISPAMAQSLSEIAIRHRLRFTAFRPLMAHVLSRHGGQLADDALLAIPEGLTCSFALRREGCWVDAFSLRFPHRDLEGQVAAACAVLRWPPVALQVAARRPACATGLLRDAQWLGLATTPQEVPDAAA